MDEKTHFCTRTNKVSNDVQEFWQSNFLHSKILQEKKMHDGKMPKYVGMSDVLINAAINFIAILFENVKINSAERFEAFLISIKKCS